MNKNEIFSEVRLLIDGDIIEGSSYTYDFLSLRINQLIDELETEEREYAQETLNSMKKNFAAIYNEVLSQRTLSARKTLR